jgi:hypothetical protein
MAKIWMPTPSGFKLDTGTLTLAVTDQSDRSCGWCWHVCVDAMYGHEELAVAEACRPPKRPRRPQLHGPAPTASTRYRQSRPRPHSP